MGIIGSYKPFGQEVRVKEAWELDDALAFFTRERREPGSWEAPTKEPSGFYHTLILLRDCSIDAAFSGKMRYAGRQAEGSIRVMRPDDRVYCTGIGPFRYLQSSFTPAYLSEYLGAFTDKVDAFELVDVDVHGDLGLTQLAQSYQAALDDHIAPTQLYLDVLRDAMFHRLVVRHTTRELRTTVFREVLVAARLRRVIDYVENNIAADLRLAELSAVAGVSRAHFARAFRNTVGMTPHAFVLERRLARATALLRHRTMPIRVIAQVCGFADHAHLSRTFRAQFGCPPQAYGST